MKVTVPVAVDGATVAVSVTLAPTVGVVVDAASVVVVAVLVAALTVTVTALDVLVAKVVDPAYTAVSESVPAVANEVASVATPALNVPVPSEVVPDMKVTVPVAVDGATVAVSVTLAPTVGVVVDAASVVVVAVLVGALMVKGMAMLTLCVPEVAVTVTVDAPRVAVLLAVRVSTLVEVVGLVPNVAVTPVGRPDAERVALLVAPVTVIVQLPLPPCTNGSGDPPPQDDEILRPPGTVREMEAVTGPSVPEVPVMVIGYVPGTVVEATVNVSTLVAVAGLAPNATVTPVGIPVAARVTLPVNPFTSVTAMVLVPVLPRATVRVAGEAERV
jgi:hypothetical protein